MTPAKPALSNAARWYIPELDGIRGIAACMVLVAHVVFTWPIYPATLERIPSWVRFILGHGWLGVDLFFVLSGFLITGILLDARDKPGYFRNFYARRFLRIIPLYFCVIAIMWLCYKGPAAFFLLSLVFLANFNLAFRVHVPHGAGVFWSLSVEEHFYLLWPWLVRFLSRRALTIVAASIVALVPCIRLWAAAAGISASKIYEYSCFRFDGLALGALLAIWVRSPRASTRSSLWLTAFLVAASIVGIPFGIMSQQNPMRFTQANLVFAAFVLFAVCRRGSAITAPLRWPVAKLCGDVSIVFILFTSASATLTSIFEGSAAGLRWSAVLASFCVGYL